MTLDELDTRLTELYEEIAELEALLFARDLEYLVAEGFLVIRNERCYPGEGM